MTVKTCWTALTVCHLIDASRYALALPFAADVTSGNVGADKRLTAAEAGAGANGTFATGVRGAPVRFDFREVTLARSDPSAPEPSSGKSKFDGEAAYILLREGDRIGLEGKRGNSIR